MVNQTQMNGNRAASEAPIPEASNVLRTNVAGLLHDVLTLGELQVQLVTLDLRETWSKSKIPAVLIAGALIFALGTIPVFLGGIGWVLHNTAGWGVGVALLVTAGVALLLAGVTAWISWRKMSSALTTLTRSQQELSSNVRWIKNALKHPQTRV